VLSSHGRTVIVVTVTAFALSILLNLGSNSLMAAFPLYVSLMLLAIVILLGIIFDVIGVAAAAGRETPLHAMASNRVRGARQGIWLVRHADKVSVFCNDVVGDIGGTLSGAIGASIVFQLVSSGFPLTETVLSTLMIAVVAALTVGGKAMAKSFAISHSVEILLLAGKLLYALEKIGFDFGKKKARRARIRDRS
jgi:CBS domain containing-hemolysin-like protein